MNLAHARALHERSGDDPRWCSTCTGEEWPCSTALALGATGYSAWDDDATPADPRPVGACPDQREYSVGAFTGRTSCIYLHNHTGAHRDDTGTTWTFTTAAGLLLIPENFDPPTVTTTPDNPHDRPVFVNHDPCTDRPGCMLHRGHDGDHIRPDTPAAGRTIHEDRCWERDLTGQAGEIGPCVMRRNHTGQHCNPNGIRWDDSQ